VNLLRADRGPAAFENGPASAARALLDKQFDAIKRRRCARRVPEASGPRSNHLIDALLVTEFPAHATPGAGRAGVATGRRSYYNDPGRDCSRPDGRRASCPSR